MATLLLIDLGGLDTESKARSKEVIKWSHIGQKLTGADSTAEDDPLAKADELCNCRSPEERRRILAGLKGVGLFSDGVAAGGNSPSTLSPINWISYAASILPVFNKPGVVAPYSQETCNVIRARVEAEKIKLVEQAL
ncbi:Saccharopine dehydrogenase [Fusarium coicis]|nr:Saccharopine dehydrogenase [Fusarium coicis]